MILVTGGAGFIGANFVLDWLTVASEAVLNVDKPTYAGNLGTLKSVRSNPKHIFARADICDRAAMGALLSQHKLRAILHFAAESHLDRSIRGPAEFVQTNVCWHVHAARSGACLLENAARRGSDGVSFFACIDG